MPSLSHPQVLTQTHSKEQSSLSYLSGGRLPWPVWQVETQTPQQEVNRYALGAACRDNGEGLVKTHLASRGLGEQKATGG
jgi:hypothetical protein